MPKTISILGSTGSIGHSVLSIIDKKKKLFRINYLTANKNYKKICNQIIKYKPKTFIIEDKNIFKKVKKKFKNGNTKIFNEFSQKNLIKSEIIVSAIPGIVGLKPTIDSITFCKKLLIANKESIICGWNLIKNQATKKRVKIIPIDSEHYSILKLIEKEKIESINKIYLTASGGPFLRYKPFQFRNIKPSDAFKHPRWKMGKKISVDSSTIMNKLLELVEAQKIFNLPMNKLDILIHPESLVHAIIEFKNGLTKFLYHNTTMIIPIANAIFENNFDIKNFYKTNDRLIKSLNFEKVDKKNFPLIKLKSVINKYPSSSIIFNAANEELVSRFIQKKLPFLSIQKAIMNIQNDSNFKEYAVKRPQNIKEITKINDWAKKTIVKKIKKYV